MMKVLVIARHGNETIYLDGALSLDRGYGALQDGLAVNDCPNAMHAGLTEQELQLVNCVEYRGFLGIRTRLHDAGSVQDGNTIPIGPDQFDSQINWSSTAATFHLHLQKDPDDAPGGEDV